MNTRIRYSLLALSLAAAVPAVGAAEERPAPEPQRKPMRNLTPPREGRPMLRDGERREKLEMETVTFLGVEAMPVSTTVSVQLGLPRGTGLVVTHVAPKSPVDGVLNEHDILLKLDDQILIETRQLAVLIRNHKEGDEVVLTYLRSGQKATAKVKLGKTEMPKMAGVFGFGGPATAGFPGGRFDTFRAPGSGEERADVDRVLSMIRRAQSGDPMRIQLEHEGGPGFRAMALHTANSNIVYSDDEGSIELTNKDGQKTLVAKSSAGEELYSGPATTPEERAAMPPAIRARLEKIEGMQNMSFRTDGDFRGAEMKVMRPRGIAVPPGDVLHTQPPRPRAFY